MEATYNSPMIKVQIKEVATQRGLMTAYQLQKAMNINPGMAARLWKGQFEMIGLKTLDHLCAVLDCEPNEILVRESGKRVRAK